LSDRSVGGEVANLVAAGALRGVETGVGGFDQGVESAVMAGKELFGDLVQAGELDGKTADVVVLDVARVFGVSHFVGSHHE